MRSLSMAGVLAAATALAAMRANAAPLVPTIEFADGPVATAPVTNGSVSFGGITVTGAPILGNATQDILQVGGSVTVGGLFNPLSIEATEFNLSNPGAVAQFIGAIAGTLAPLSSISWSVYLDRTNTPFGTGELIASGNFADPSSIVSLGFFQPATGVPETITGPFALSEFFTISAPAGSTVSFNSSATGTFSSVPEPGSVAMLGVGLLGLGLVTPLRRRARAPA
jgi:hypothetical protein